MRKRKRVAGKTVAMLVLALAGFGVAGLMSGVGLATDTTTGTTTEPPPTTTTEPPPTTTAPPGNEGCTPGFWKNHTEAWVGYDPDDLVGGVFADAPGSVSGLTLLAGLQLGGGGVNALTRHAIAALLNAAHPDVDYPLTEAQIIDMVNDAFTSGDVESLKDTLDEFNNATAPGFCD